MSRIPTFAEIPAGFVHTSIPLGLTETGMLLWNPDVEPHMLLTGRTRTGKTSLVRTVIKGLSERGADIVLIDPKRSALVDVASLPGVLGRATSRDLDDVSHKIGWVERRMMERYDALEQGARAEDLNRLVLVVDEGRLLYELTKTHWNTVVKPRELARAKAVKSPVRPVGTEHPCIEQIRSILRLGGEAKVSVVLISQQADASWLSTEARQNLGMRVALGNMDDDGLGMMFGRRTRLEPLPTGEDGAPIKGRAYAATVGDRPVQMQAFWTPEIPRPDARVPGSLPTQPIPVQQQRRSLLRRLVG
ncbi:FtsK/SpoIIIE domain-containing protein [Terracoccus sp. 273MFTsu3.1]|uniref:FtsK/SpoIIIE domain-containing protein n=1 Tax=Terracoccus sp. 273MFTsu3.1 TaxID=1172188 RepID=UPI00039F04D5|nr:FtsK/SpoIIIE domain-containing protein [Terracoccus sp. 273MFTsu3.1]